MKKAWRKILVAWCTIAILIMISSVYVSADELIVSTAEEVILETNDTEQPNSDSLSAEGESSEPVDEVVQEEDDFREITDESEKDVLLEKDESTDALVGALESTGNGTLDRFINDSRFTSGVYWPSGQTPKIASYQGWGCCAYCADYVKYCLGTNNPRGGTYFANINEVRQGDVLIVGNPSDGTGHWFVCLKRSGNRLYVAEGNFSSHVRIGWNYTISGSKFAEDGRYFNCGYHFQLNTAPGAASLTCRPGTSLAPTLFIWSNAYGATTYSLRIFKGECWVGENIKNEWELTRTSSQVQLPAGYYEAYVDACNENGYTMSNIVKFNVQKASIANATITNIIDKTYTGSPQTQSPKVQIGNIGLVLDRHYTLSYSNNTNVGTATVTITGKGDCSGTVRKTFTINRATPKLAFKSSSVTKMQTDDAFTNTLKRTTDGTVTFKSSNTTVATVNRVSGLVTIKGLGTTTITANASEGTNYKSGSASYTLTVKAAPSPTPTTNGFSDVQDPSHAYYDAIYWAADAGITKGYPDGTFGINRSCTRGEMMMFLWRYDGHPAPKAVAKSPFTDVPKNHVFYNAILWGSQKGITKGYPDGKFGVDRNVSRGECMMFLWRLKGKPAPKAVAKSPFTDVPKNHVFYNAILWGSQNKITTGYTSGVNKGKFMIDDNCSRGQIVTFLYRAKG